MTSAEQMELMIKIRAQGQDAQAQLKRIEDRMSGIKSAGAGIGGGAKAAFDGLSKGAHAAARGLHVVLAPLWWIAKGMGVAGAAALAFGGLAVRASGNMEVLKLRLDGVTASAEESKRIFEDVKQLGIASPFSDSQMADAAIALRQFAMYSRTNLQTISDTATVAQRDMQEVVMAIVGMEAEPLRRLGIQFSAAGGNFVARYRTKLGEVRTATAKTRDEAGQMLMDIFKTRFGGAAGSFAGAWKGVTSTLKGAIEQALARLGDGTRERLAGMIGELNGALGKLIDSGKLDEIGQKIGAGVEASIDYIRAAFATVSQLSKTDAFGVMVMEAAAGAGEVMGRGFIEYLKAGYGVIEGLFRAAFAVVAQEYRQSDLPGAAGARRRFARQQLEGMTPEQASGLGIPAEYAGKEYLKLPLMQRMERKLEIEKFANDAASARAPWIGNGAEREATAMFEGGLRRTASAVTDAVANMRTIVGDVTARRQANIAERTGYDPAGAFEGHLDYIRGRRVKAPEEAPAAPAPEGKLTGYVQRVQAAMPVRDTAGQAVFDENNNPVLRGKIKQGMYKNWDLKAGDNLPSGAIVISIENLTIRANTPQELIERVRALGASPVVVPGAY